MYTDDKTWKQHYEEWKRILPTIKGDCKCVEYKKKVFTRLIQQYDSQFNK